MTTPPELVALATRRLAAARVPTPDVDAELLVGHAAGLTRTQVKLAREPLQSEVLADVEGLLRRREMREPLQLIIGTVGFRYLDIQVRPGVFIPRPETEMLAGEAISRTPTGGVVLEPCTGTGAVACAVAQEAAPRLVVATDIDPAAVDLAGHNARLFPVVQVRYGALLDPVGHDLRGQVDVLVSNPPYLAEGELEGLEPEVTDHDPVAALVAGQTGHEISDVLIFSAAEWLRPGGWLLLELDASRTAEAADRCRAAGLTDVSVVDDMTGAPRIVVAQCQNGPADNGLSQPAPIAGSC